MLIYIVYRVNRGVGFTPGIESAWLEEGKAKEECGRLNKECNQLYEKCKYYYRVESHKVNE